jgi:acetyl-CoA C-acetyltransferase
MRPGGKVAIACSGIIKKFGENSQQSPVSPSGGLESCGHPIGSSGIRVIANVHDQLLGRAEEMPVKGARAGLAYNVGGPGAVSAVAVLS